MANLQHPIATFMLHRAQNLPRKATIQSSIPVSSAPSKLTKKKNYLRRKILKTLTKPQSIPLSPPNPEDPVDPSEPIEPHVEFASEPTSEKQPHSNFVEESEMSFGANESSLDQFQVVQASERQDVKSFNVISGRTVVRIFASFVGLFIIQTVVSVWVLGSGDSDEKDRNMGIENQQRDFRLGMRKGGVVLNGNAILGNWDSPNMGESEMEAKIAEIRKMAREAREIEKKESLRSDKEEVTDITDSGGDDDDDLETDSPKIQSGIVKEVDKRLMKLRKRSLAPMLNANYLNIVGDTKEGRNKGEDCKGEDDMLMFEIKHKFRSHSPITRDKPKGFQTIEGDHGAREKPMYMDDEQPIQQMTGNANGYDASLANDNKEINGLGVGSPKRSNIDSSIDEKKSMPESSGPLKASKKGFGSNGGTKRLNKQQTSSKKSGSKSATKEPNKRINRGAKPKTGVVQDYNHVNPVDNESISKDSSVTVTQDSSRKMTDQHSSTMSKTYAMSHSKVQPNSDKLGSKLSMSRDDIWWFTLPYIIVILMQTDSDSEGQLGFYTIRIYSDAKNQSYTPYIVGFEDRSDARNFSYLLELAFEDLPNTAIDVVPLSAKDLKETMELLNKKVIVVKKGQLHLYAGQPLDEVESALISLVQ